MPQPLHRQSPINDEGLHTDSTHVNRVYYRARPGLMRQLAGPLTPDA